MRILVMNHVTTRSGGEIILLRFLRQLDKGRFEILVALPSNQGMLPEELEKIAGVRVLVIPADPFLVGTRRFNAIRSFLRRPGMILAFFDLVKRCVRVIQEEHIELILTNSIKSDYYGALAGALTRRPVVWYLHDFVDEHYFPRWARDSLVLFANLFPAKIVCVSNASRASLIQAGVDGRKLITVYGPPIEPTETHGSDTDLYSELGLSSKTVLITMVGRISAPKGQIEFVQAARTVLYENRDAIFLIVGDSVFGAYDDDYKRQVEHAIRQLPQPERVRMLGMRQDVMRIVALSDVIVLHSLWPEGFPLAVAEAMTLGRPIIATQAGGTVEMIEDGVTGLTVQPGDVIGLSRAICRLLDNPEEARTLGQAGQQRIKQLLSLNNVYQFQTILEDVARRQ